MKLLSLFAAAAVFLVLGACERHSWEDVDADGDGQIGVNEKGTKRLYKDDGHAGESAEKHPEETGEKGAHPEPQED